MTDQLMRRVKRVKGKVEDPKVTELIRTVAAIIDQREMALIRQAFGLQPSEPTFQPKREADSEREPTEIIEGTARVVEREAEDDERNAN